ncbi:MAG: LysR family transcriptional regulator [Zavarzinia sp.]|nr:LysR family transcriptional regulator [Zavarzinia sp.]
MTEKMAPGREAVVTMPITDADIKLLAVFITVVRCGGFSLAQNALNVSQSTISIQISNLESRIGAKLCKRGRSGFTLTPEGAEVFEAAKALFAQLEDYRARIGGIKGKLIGDINIGIIDNLIVSPDFRLHEAIRAFKSVAHDVHVNLSVAPPNELERQVLEGQAHLAIGFFPRRVSQLQYEPLFTMGMELYCGRRHPLFALGEDEVTPEDVMAAEHVQRGYVSIDQMNHMHRRFKFTARAHNIEGIAYFILSGHYLGFLSTVYARRWVETGEMRSVRPDVFGYTSNYDVVYRRNVPETLAFRHALRCVREHMGGGA